MKIRHISSIHQYLTVELEVEAAKTVLLFTPSWTIVILFYQAAPFIFSVDYGKFITAAKLVFKAQKYDPVQTLVQALHWLLVQARIDYKLSVIFHISDSPLSESLCSPLSESLCSHLSVRCCAIEMTTFIIVNWRQDSAGSWWQGDEFVF